MEEYCVKAVKREEWEYDKTRNYYPTQVIMQHIMNDMAKQGWVVRSTTYSDASGDYCVLITFARSV